MVKCGVFFAVRTEFLNIIWRACIAIDLNGTGCCIYYTEEIFQSTEYRLFRSKLNRQDIYTLAEVVICQEKKK
jgi:hypothetical protein